MLANKNSFVKRNLILISERVTSPDSTNTVQTQYKTKAHKQADRNVNEQNNNSIPCLHASIID